MTWDLQQEIKRERERAKNAESLAHEMTIERDKAKHALAEESQAVARLKRQIRDHERR